jgi:mercuric ion binding protein
VKVNVDYKKKTTTVTYLTARTNVENIKALIANVGYDADDVTAEPDAYKRLPTCCKKPEDGGPAKKN